MLQQTKTFRVFVSSTFTDMKEERRILQKKVFPDLEKLCESKGAKFQAVDLRWGVNEASQLDQKSMDICLSEISRCQRISPKPNFIALIGNKYGSQPMPSRIPSKEMNQIFKILEEKPDELIEIENNKVKVIDFVNQWYKLDENAIPPEYILQPRQKLEKKSDETKDELKEREYNQWKVKEDVLQNIFRNAINKANPKFTEKQKRKYFYSATHQEIIKGIIDPLDENENIKGNAFAYVRNIKDLPYNETGNGYIDLIGDKKDEYCQQQLEGLKLLLKDKLKENYFQYDAEWKDVKTGEYDLTVFANKVYKDLKTIIENEIDNTVSANEIIREANLHKEFKERLTEHFCGRKKTINEIEDYLNNTTDNKILSIIGESGSGKSSLMAQAIQLTENKKQNAFIIYRFIGTSSRSTNLLTFLHNLCEHIAKEFNVTLEALAGNDYEKSLHELNGITEVFSKCIALATENKPIILFLDALDQFSDSENIKSLYWLPKELPQDAKIIVSSLLTLKEYLNETKIIELPPLSETEAKYILEIWFKANNRKLTSLQSKEVLDKFNLNGSAIYLKLAFEQTKHWHSYNNGITLQPDVKGIINDFFDYLDIEHTKDFVTNTVCYILCGRYEGLTEDEILEILVFDKEYWKTFLENTHKNHRKDLKGVTKIPFAPWARLFHDLEPYLAERDADGVPIIIFSHRIFVEVLRVKYKLVEESVEE